MKLLLVQSGVDHFRKVFENLEQLLPFPVLGGQRKIGCLPPKL
jgi:hypothetical protein